MLLSLFQPHPVGEDPQLIPSAAQMRREGVSDLETWFGGGREWLSLLRLVGGLRHDSWVLEIQPGYGQVTYALRRLLTSKSSYDGLESDPRKVEFLENAYGHALSWTRFKL